MENSYKYFNNSTCKYYPCHKILPEEKFNCLFCYCPMNRYDDCLGTPKYIYTAFGKVIKDCSNCIYPHQPENYDKIMKYLTDRM